MNLDVRIASDHHFGSPYETSHVKIALLATASLCDTVWIFMDFPRSSRAELPILKRRDGCLGGFPPHANASMILGSIHCSK